MGQIARKLLALAQDTQMSKRVFQIAYDRGLMITRELLLNTRGYRVISVFGNNKAIEALSNGVQYDIFIVGHAESSRTRAQMVQWLRDHFPNAKIVALNPPFDSIPSADYNIRLNGPDEWLRAVSDAIG
jgi:hypothetical protein